jgi:hypothetical protein
MKLNPSTARPRRYEQTARAQADMKAKSNQALYAQTLEKAQQAFAEKRYDQAIAFFQEAGKIFKTDTVLNGVRQAEEARGKMLAAATEEKRVSCPSQGETYGQT